MRQERTSKRIKIVFALLLAVTLALLVGFSWMWHIGWHADSNASVTIDGLLSHHARVYLSHDKQEILIDPGDARECFLYLVSLRQKRVGVTYYSDFDVRNKFFAKPSKSNPPRDWIPNELDDSTEPHLIILNRSIQFVTSSQLHLQVRY